MEQTAIGLLHDYGIIQGLFVIMFLGTIVFLPKFLNKLANKHFEALDKLSENNKENLQRVVETFQQQIKESNAWHVKHSEVLNEVKSDVKDVKTFLIKNIQDNNVK